MSGMDICTETSFPQPDLAQLLPRAAFYEIAWMLRRSLPPPLTDNPVELERRDQAAMAAVASLLPVTVAEGRLAAQFASADAGARECLAMAAERRREPGLMRHWMAQAVSLMRESKSALRELRQMQKERRKREADAEAANRAEWEEHGAVGMMRGALDDAGELESVGAVADCETESHVKTSETVERRRDVGGSGCGEAGEGVGGRNSTRDDLGGGSVRDSGGIAGMVGLGCPQQVVHRVTDHCGRNSGQSMSMLLNSTEIVRQKER